VLQQINSSDKIELKDEAEIMKTTQTLFKWRHFEAEIILLCVRRYLRYALSYRDLEEILLERGLRVDHTTHYVMGNLTVVLQKI
jgi:hypothetical protein